MDIRADVDHPEAARPPWPMWLIALLCMAPFPASAFFYAYAPDRQAEQALTVILTWSAVVMGFLGGIRWGLETARSQPRWTRLSHSLISPLAGWALLFTRGTIDTPWLLGGFLVAFILQWLFDHTAPDVPARYPRLMTILTLGACLSLAVALEESLTL